MAFHLALIMVLMRSFKTLPLSAPAATPLELIRIPQAITPKTRPQPPLPNSFHVDTKVAPTTPITITAPQPIAPNEGEESTIDWAGEAQRAAAGATAPGPAVQSFDHHFPAESEAPKSIFDEPAEHHAGEQFRTDDGRWVVYVNDNCYQVSDPLASSNASANGMGVQTYCKGRSKTPRGDLFDQLPAYKQYHTPP